MYLKNQSFLVAGLSRSGLSAAKFLIQRQAKVYIYDELENDFVKSAVLALTGIGCKQIKKEQLEESCSYIDVLVLSPGIPIDNHLPVLYKKEGKRIIGETELGALFLTCPVIAVTGTNGKTTTVSLISAILDEGGVENIACGNIGVPLTAKADELEDGDLTAVLEVSSFQLETLFSLKPHICVITNITPDHLNRHYNMENYIFLKQKLLANLKESEYAVLNYDDDTVRGFEDKTRANVVWFSLKQKVEGCYLNDGFIWYMENPVVCVSDLGVRGNHNIANCMAAVAAAKLMGISDAAIEKSLTVFKGVKHRIELVKDENDIRYYNDSKGTNVDSTVKAVESMDRPTIVLLGGKDKDYDYGDLFKMFTGSRVKHAVLFGENRFKLTDSAFKNNFLDITVCKDLRYAVLISKLLAERGDNVLLSPASSSFDEFSNYEERGDRFVELVTEGGGYAAE